MVNTDMSANLGGAPTIRASKKRDRFADQNHKIELRISEVSRQ